MDDKQIFETWETFKELLRKTKRENIENLIKWLDESDFKFAPASTQYHNNFRGGLLQHSLDVYYHMYDFKSLIDLFELKEDTLILTALLHDICKVYCYQVDYRNVKNENGEWVKTPYYKWQELLPGYGHGTKSVILIQNTGVKLTELEQSMIINHMGFSGTTDTKIIAGVSQLFEKYPQCLILHYADESSTFLKEGKTLQTEFRNKLLGRNVTESLKIYEKQTQFVNINGQEYKLAPSDAVVDGREIIQIPYTNTSGLQVTAKVYSPHKDGLPF